MAWYEKIDELSESLIKLDEKLGMKKIIQYLFLALLLAGILNAKDILKWGIELIGELSNEIHVEKMERRDQLLQELVPELHELLGLTGADRVLYFEYHNSKENLVGIPFKYVDLVQQSVHYGVPSAPLNNFRDINIGNLTNLYEDLKVKKVIPCTAQTREEFKLKYQGNYEFFNENDGSVQQIFINIPGVKQPIGMIVIEWLDDKQIDTEEISECAHESVHIINGLILKYM